MGYIGRKGNTLKKKEGYMMKNLILLGLAVVFITGCSLHSLEVHSVIMEFSLDSESELVGKWIIVKGEGLIQRAHEGHAGWNTIVLKGTGPQDDIVYEEDQNWLTLEILIAESPEGMPLDQYDLTLDLGSAGDSDSTKNYTDYPLATQWGDIFFQFLIDVGYDSFY